MERGLIHPRTETGRNDEGVGALLGQGIRILSAQFQRLGEGGIALTGGDLLTRTGQHHLDITHGDIVVIVRRHRDGDDDIVSGIAILVFGKCLVCHSDLTTDKVVNIYSDFLSHSHRTDYRQQG